MNTKLSVTSTKFARSQNPPNKGSHHFPNAANAALNMSETINRKPIPKIIPKESSRVRINPDTPASSVFFGARHILSRSSCSSANTVVAPIRSKATPIIVAVRLSVGLLTLSSKPCTTNASVSPMKFCNWVIISPLATSVPKINPAIDITISRSGAIENTA